MDSVYGQTTEELECGGQRPKKTLCSWVWKVCGVLALLFLCTATALIFIWHLQKENVVKEYVETEKQMADEQSTVHHETLKQVAGVAKAAIHLEGEVDQTQSNTSVLWSSRDGHAFSQGALKVDQNKILIPRTGLYFVYSQASYHARCSPANDEHEEKRFLHLAHSVLRHSNSYNDEKTLLGTIRSACGDARSRDLWFSNIYLGAVFHLEKGDKLRTITSPLEKVDLDPGKTFFGVFAL